MDIRLLKSVMVKNGDTQRDLADAMCLSPSRLSAKINEKRADFRLRELAFIQRRYNLSSDDIYAIFFNPKVSFLDTQTKELSHA